MGTREKDKLIGFLKTNDTLLHTLYSNEIFNLLRSTIMQTRKRRNKRKSKRGGSEVYLMGGILLALTVGLTVGLSQFTGPYNDGNTEEERQRNEEERLNIYAIENPPDSGDY
jgi:hypothetical protein